MDAAKQFFGALNTEGMTPVHKWLLLLVKKVEISQNRSYFSWK